MIEDLLWLPFQSVVEKGDEVYHKFLPSKLLSHLCSQDYLAKAGMPMDIKDFRSIRLVRALQSSKSGRWEIQLQVLRTQAARLLQNLNSRH